jgi:hypothetical protein
MCMLSSETFILWSLKKLYLKIETLYSFVCFFLYVEFKWNIKMNSEGQNWN